MYFGHTTFHFKIYKYIFTLRVGTRLFESKFLNNGLFCINRTCNVSSKIKFPMP